MIVLRILSEKESLGSKELRDGYEFFSFGHGPRNCIGMRFALMQSKIAILRLITNYKLEPCAKTIDQFVQNSAIIGQKLNVNLYAKGVKRDP